MSAHDGMIDTRDRLGRSRVVVTGIGVKTPAGCDIDTFWRTVRAGRSVAAPIRSVDTADLRVHFACEVRDFDPSDYMGPKQIRRTDRIAQLGLAAAVDALADAGEIAVDPARCAVVFGSSVGGIDTLGNQAFVFRESGPNRVSPYSVPMTMLNGTGALIGIELGWTGPNFAICTACTSSTNAIGEATRLIRHGVCDIAIGGGSEAPITPWMIAVMTRMGAMSMRNDDPASACRPFDMDRDGYVLGEGGAFFLLERLDLALARGARIYGEVAGYGLNCDAFHVTAPSPGGTGAAACMQLALDDADLATSDIGHINAHGTSTPLNDASESGAVLKVFGDAAPPVTAPKGIFGHLMGGAGGAEAVVALLAARDGVIPPTANYQTPDPECAVDIVAGSERQTGPKPVLSNSFGLGGHNATLALVPFPGNGSRDSAPPHDRGAGAA